MNRKVKSSTNKSTKSAKSNLIELDKPLISITREDDEDYCEVLLSKSQFESNKKKYEQESEHRNYRDYLESNEHIYDTINDNCFNLCPTHCTTTDSNNNRSPINNLENQSIKKCNSILKKKKDDNQNLNRNKRCVRFEDNNNDVINESRHNINELRCSNNYEIKKSKYLNNEINRSKYLNNNYRGNRCSIHNYAINSSRCLIYDNRTNRSRYLNYDNKYGLKKSRYYDINYEINGSRYYDTNYGSNRYSNCFYHYYLNKINIKFNELIDYLKYDLFNYYNIVYFFIYLFIFGFFFILHYFISASSK